MLSARSLRHCGAKYKIPESFTPRAKCKAAGPPSGRRLTAAPAGRGKAAPQTATPRAATRPGGGTDAAGRTAGRAPARWPERTRARLARRGRGAAAIARRRAGVKRRIGAAAPVAAAGGDEAESRKEQRSPLRGRRCLRRRDPRDPRRVQGGGKKKRRGPGGHARGSRRAKAAGTPARRGRHGGATKDRRSDEKGPPKGECQTGRPEVRDRGAAAKSGQGDPAKPATRSYTGAHEVWSRAVRAVRLKGRSPAVNARRSPRRLASRGSGEGELEKLQEWQSRGGDDGLRTRRRPAREGRSPRIRLITALASAMTPPEHVVSFAIKNPGADEGSTRYGPSTATRRLYYNNTSSRMDRPYRR